MTCNQMMLLLSMYRGTEHDEMKIGTYKDDIKFLQWSRLINKSPKSNRWRVTSKGALLVEKVLEQN